MEQLKYYIGLDIGSNSIGWAVTDADYNIVKFRGRSMWGVRLCEEAQTAVERRIYRTNRRRMQRRRERISMLNEIFADEIKKIDKNFFVKLNESSLLSEDRSINDSSFLFPDFYKYKTIYHLRKSVTEGTETDLRAVYLVVHHIVKYRGNFLLEGQKINEIKDADNIFIELNQTIEDVLNLNLDLDNITEIRNELINNSSGVKNKKKILSEILFGKQVNSDFTAKSILKCRSALIDALVGSKCKLADLFPVRVFGGDDVNNFAFSSSDYEDKCDGLLKELLGDDYCLIERLKSVYDWSVLQRLLGGHDCISDSMIAVYDKHKHDLATLKSLLRDKYPREAYNKIFGLNNGSKDENKKGNYSSYVGMCIDKGKKYALNKTSKEDLYSLIKNVLGEKSESADIDERYEEIMSEISKNSFLPKQLSPDNSVIPYQLNMMELDKIIEKCEFLKRTDSDGIMTGEKVRMILTYRIPYYVGPLNTFNSDSVNNKWAVRKAHTEGLKIRPWNFDKIIDLKQSAAAFIENLTNNCTYLKDCKVTPQKSILYSEFMLHNEINKLKINGRNIDAELKTQMLDTLFMKEKTVTKKKIAKWLAENRYIKKDEITVVNISGIDDTVKANRGSLINFVNILGGVDKVAANIEKIENIIKWITVFSDKNMVIEKINDEYPGIFTGVQLKEIKSLNFTGWSGLSREFLTEIKSMNKDTGEYCSIIEVLQGDTLNLQEILNSEKYDFISEINKFNGADTLNEISYTDVEQLYCSPKVKRVIWQSVRLVNEIVKIMKCDPSKIFIEMARDTDGKNEKKRKDNRKNQLLQLYSACGKDCREWSEKLKSTDDNLIKSEKIFLYYCQLGKCMYTGETIDYESLIQNTGKYDVDHIIPRALKKDDSILNNKVLVLSKENKNKSDTYPLPSRIRNGENMKLWFALKEKGLITQEKFDRLIRTAELTDEEKAAFISRQIVETRQSTKAVADLFKRAYCESEIVYVKADNVSSFRHNYDMVKVREINDLHHAKDAYLNVVVGDLYNNIFGHSPIAFIRKNKSDDGSNLTYNFENLLKRNIDNKGKRIWTADNGESVAKVRKIYNRNDVTVTRMSFVRKGKFYDENLVKKRSELVPITEDKRNPKFDTAKYGGYNGFVNACFFLVEHTIKKKRVMSFESLPIYKFDRISTADKLTEYAKSIGLKDPVIIDNCIRINTLIKLGDSLAYITGKSNDNLLLENATQFFFDNEISNKLKKILKFANANNKNKENVIISKYDGFCEDDLYAAYDAIVDKLNVKALNSLSNLQNVKVKLQLKRDVFVGLQNYDKAYCISQMLCLLQCNCTHADLRLLGETKDAGKLGKTKNLSGYKEKLSIIYPSVTGMYMNKKEILT